MYSLPSCLSDCHHLAYFCNIWELGFCISQDFTVSELFSIPWKIPKHRKQQQQQKKKGETAISFFFQVSYLCYWCVLLEWWGNITREAWVKFISKEWYTESWWNTVLWKMELGPVLIDASAALSCKLEIRCRGSQRCVYSARPDPPGKVWINSLVAVIGYLWTF